VELADRPTRPRARPSWSPASGGHPGAPKNTIEKTSQDRVRNLSFSEVGAPPRRRADLGGCSHSCARRPQCLALVVGIGMRGHRQPFFRTCKQQGLRL